MLKSAKQICDEADRQRRRNDVIGVGLALLFCVGAILIIHAAFRIAGSCR